jgi:hypothetical protein
LKNKHHSKKRVFRKGKKKEYNTAQPFQISVELFPLVLGQHVGCPLKPVLQGQSELPQSQILGGLTKVADLHLEHRFLQ